MNADEDLQQHSALATKLASLCDNLRTWAIDPNATKLVRSMPQGIGIQVSIERLDTTDRAKLMRLSRRFEIVSKEMRATHEKIAPLAAAIQAVAHAALMSPSRAQEGIELGRILEQLP